MVDVTDWTSQVRRGLLECCILGLIEAEPRYGYEIVSHLSAVAQLAAGEGTIYPLLRRLKKDGWLETYWQESDAGPPRQYYRLTNAGAEALDTMRVEWKSLVEAVNRFIQRGDQP